MRHKHYRISFNVRDDQVPVIVSLLGDYVSSFEMKEVQLNGYAKPRVARPKKLAGRMLEAATRLRAHAIERGKIAKNDKTVQAIIKGAALKPGCVSPVLSEAVRHGMLKRLDRGVYGPA